MNNVFTIGNEETYDRGLQQLGDAFCKMGAKPPRYPGGFALKTVEDACRLIDEFGKQSEWAVYRLEADWDKDTKPSDNGWWHSLQRDATILEKAQPAELMDLSG